jgi:pre-mRNA-processing factor SLU7
MTVRNLRIREDTAKYLRNLDLQSAHYDPKTRSMRENPTPDDHPSDAFVRGGEGGAKSSALQKFAGDNVNRGTGEAVGFERLASHASAAFDKGQEIHPQAGPSAAELLYKQFREKKSKLAEQTRSSILDTYGDASVKQPAPEGLLLGQTEAYSEYDRAGRLLRGAERAAQKSRYEEDVLDQNHTHVWGSFWSGGRWGYACCRSHQKGSYCTGAKGIAAAAAAGDLMLANLERREAARAAEEAARERDDPGSVHASVSGMRNPFGDASKWGEKEETVADVALDPQKLMKALREEDARLKTGGEEEEPRSDEAKKKKRAYNADREEAEPTEEEMEAFRMKRKRENDPMAEKESLGTKGYDLV